jgi:putative transposase
MHVVRDMGSAYVAAMTSPILSRCSRNARKEKPMSRFRKLSHAIWHCQYHIVWVPKYRYRVLEGPLGLEVYNCLRVFLGQNGCECVEMNVQPTHVHLITMIPPKKSVSEMMGILKGRTAIRGFKQVSIQMEGEPVGGGGF